jgi:hypothetical protein
MQLMLVYFNMQAIFIWPIHIIQFVSDQIVRVIHFSHSIDEIT